MQSRSRIHSRNPSRAASPALSVRSRRSTMSMRQRQKYLQHDDLTDDEDSDLERFTDDSRSRQRKQLESSRGRRERRNTEQLELTYRDNEVINRIQKMKVKSKNIREKRSGSLTHWPMAKDRESGSLTPSDDDDLRKLSSKFRKSSMTPPTAQNKEKHLDSASSDGEFLEKRKEKIKPSKSAIISESASDGEKNKKGQSQLKENLKSLNDSQKVIENIAASLSNADEKLKIEQQAAVESCPSSVPFLFKVGENSNNNSNKSSNSRFVKSTELEPKVEEKTKTPTAIENPLGNWECEHCTFVNEESATVCSICCKTRVEVLKQLPKMEDDIDINEINDSILQNENEVKQKGKMRKISFLPGTKAH
jgi:E3 ubiquitin-protein ligase RNF31